MCERGGLVRCVRPAGYSRETSMRVGRYNPRLDCRVFSFHKEQRRRDMINWIDPGIGRILVLSSSF